MKQHKFMSFYLRMRHKKLHCPLEGQIELTYRCSLDCVHCYCKGLEDKRRELTTSEFKKIFDDIRAQGCMLLTLTGGDPLIRPDFLELYSYAKQKGFLVSIFTNGHLFTEEIFGHIKRSPPLTVEITLNGITRKTYESITRVEGSFEKALRTIRRLKKDKINLVLKANCLKQNKHEIGKIKAFTERTLGKPSLRQYRFKLDPLIMPRLNGDMAPCQHRLSFEELLEIRKQDPDIWQEFEQSMCYQDRHLLRKPEYLYHCNSWLSNFFVDPFGLLRFCEFLDKFSVDLRVASFAKAFFQDFPKVAALKFQTKAPCRLCTYRKYCQHCPGKAYLETGSEQAPVAYFCEMARKTAAFETAHRKDKR